MKGQRAQFDEGPPATPYRPALWLAAAAGMGIAADNQFNAAGASGLFGWWCAAAAAALLAGAATRRRKWFTATALLTLASVAALGGAWHHWRWNYVSHHDLARYARDEPQPACVEVVLADRVRISPASERSPLRAIPARTFSETAVEVRAIRDGEHWCAASGWSRLRVAGVLRDVGKGDRLVVFAQLGRQPAPMNPGQYDWAAAERRAGRLSELYCDNVRCVSLAEPASGWLPASWLRGVRGWCEEQLTRNVSPRDAPLVLATLLGDQERLSDETKGAFMETGSIHLLVVSGMHVALLAGIVWWTARAAGLSKGWQLALTVTIVGIYAMVVGWQPSVLRATLLALATIEALRQGRSASAGNLLGAAALVVMVHNPCELFRAGTQFSFISVGVLATFAKWSARERAVDPLDRLVAETRPWATRALRSVGSFFWAMTVASLVVGVAIAPLVAHHFHIVTPASVLLTPLAWPAIAAALGSGLAVVTVGWLVPALGEACGAICGWSLHLTEQGVLAAQGMPGGYSYCAGFPAWWLCVLYGIAGIMAVIPRWRPRWQWQVSLGMLWLAGGLFALGAQRNAKDELRCTFLSVGHGTCAVMELPGGQTILYDAGSLSSPEAATQTIASFLWSRSIDRIDAIVLSHADVDHYNAVPGLIERFPIGVVYISPMMFDPVATDGNLAAPNYLRDVLAESGVLLKEIWMGDRLSTADDAVTIEVFHPPREGVIGRDNANSVLLSVTYAGRRILLPGDLESPGIERVMADPPLDCDILLAPHHGSENSDPPGFAAWCTPEAVVMSGRRPDRTLTAHHTYKRAGAVVAHTAHWGAVTCLISPRGQVVVGFRREPGPGIKAADATRQAGRR